MEDEQVAGVLQPGHAEAAVLREKATVPLLLKSGIIQDIREPETSRADDPDSCQQYTVNAVSGERHAPPKTEDGGDTEEVDATLSMVYVRIHTGSSLPGSMLKTGELESLAAAELAGDGCSSLEHALHTEQHSLPSTSEQEVAAAVAEHPDDGTAAPAPEAKPASTEQVAGTAKELAQAAANWEGVYQDVLQRIYSSKVFAEDGDQQLEHAAGADSGQEQQQEKQHAGEQQQASAQLGPDAAVELQAAHMAAHAIASAYTEADGDEQPPVSAPADSSSADLGPAQVSAAPSTQETPMQATPAVHAAHEAVQDACSSGHNTPVVLPADAADLPVQAVLDELDSLLAKSDELRSSVQLRSSRQFPDQHSATQAAAGKDGLSVLDRPLTGNTAASHGRSGSMSGSHQSADWDAAAANDSSQPSADGADDDKSGSSKERPSMGDGDLEDSFKRTVLDSTEARDEIRQHLQMVVDGTGGEQEATDRRDAATSVGGLITPRKEQGQGSPSHLAHSSVGGTGPKPHDTSPDRGAAAAAPAGDDAACEAGFRRSSSNVGAGSTAGTRRGSRYNTTDSISSMDKLHALYARYMSDSASRRPSSTGDLATPSSSNTGRQSRRATGTGPTISAVAAATATAPMRSSLPYPVAALATATQPLGAKGERRSRSVSPQKAPRQAHALNQDNLQHQQEAHRQHSCSRQLQHSVSLCSSCGGPLQRGASLHSRAGSAANQAMDPASPAALPSKGLATITGSSDAAGAGIHTFSDPLPSTHISLSALMANGGLSADAARWERPEPQLTTVLEPSSAAALASGCLSGSPVDQRGREDAAALRASGTRSAYSASPVRGGQGARAGGYTDRGPHWGTLSTSAVPARRAASHSPERHRGAQRATSPTASHSDIKLSKEGVGLATLSFGQLLQETAVEQALGQLQQDVASSLNSSPRTSPPRGGIVPAAATACGSAVLPADAEAVQEAGSVLQVVPEDGVVVGPATKTQTSLRRTHSPNSSRRHLVLSSPHEVSPCVDPDHAPPCSPAAAAAAAALKELAQSTAKDELQQQSGPCILSHCSSMQDVEHSTSRRSSSADPRRCLTASSSMRSHTSALSAGSSKVWRPGGNRTDPKDDYRKLQTYESARLRALVKQGLLSPGCSTRHLLPGEEAAEGAIGSVSPKSRRSTANDLATPVSPGPPSHFGSAPASPSSAASPAGYAAASARRKLGLTASPAAGTAAAASPSPRQARSAGRPASAPAARAGAVRAVGSKSVLEPAHTSVFLADLASGSPPGPQRCASPSMYKKPQRKASPHVTQQNGSVLGSLPAAKPVKQQQQPQRAGINLSRSGRKQTYASTAPQASSGRPQSGHTLQPLGGSRRAPSSGNSTTAQVEEAIRAAQAALLEKKRQVTYARQALNLMRASAGSSRGYSKQAAASPSMQAHADDDGMSSIRDSSSIWGGSSCNSSYRGGRISKDLAAAFAAAAASQGAAGHHQVHTAGSTPAAAEAQAATMQAPADPAHPAVVDAHGDGHSPAGSSVPDNGRKHDAAPVSAVEAEAAAGLPGAPAVQETPAGSAYTIVTVEASSSPTQPLGRSPAAAAEQTAVNSQQGAAASALVAKPSAARSPVQQQGRHKSRSPKRRPVSALEALLGLTPEDPEDSPQQHPVRPSSAQPVMSSLAALSPHSRSASLVSAAKRAAAGTGAGSAKRGKAVPQLSVQAGGVAARRSSGGGSGCVAEPWSAPRRRSSAGLTGEQLMELHRRRSAAEAAEAAAAAAEGDAEAAECCEHTMPLDVLVRAYTALNKKNKNSSERTAAVAMLLNQITEGPTAHAGTSQGTSPDAAHASSPADHGADNSPSAEQPQHKLRSSPSPGADGIRLDVLGRGLGLCLPDSPSTMGPGSTLGFANGPPSPSAIIQTLKADSLSSWHRTSPERQAAHASLLATPKHKQASSYAADLAALAAASSSNLYAERSVHNKADSSPASAGKQQQQQPGSSSAPPDASAGDAPVSAEPSLSQAQTRQGSVAGAAPRGCTPLRNVRLSNSQSGAAPEVVLAHLQEQHLSTQTEETQELSIAPPASRKPMVETATGRLVLDSIGAHDMTVSAALTWLKAGLQTPEQAQAQAARAASPRPRSTKRLGHSRPCSPFSCFGGKSRAMARSSDGSEEGGAVGSPGGQQQHEQQQQQVAEQDANADGVTFQMGADNRLVMIIQQAGTAGPQRLQVTGIRLHLNAEQGGGSSASHVLDLITDGGTHTIELASESDWAGLVVGLNSMLLLLEQQEPQEVERLGAVPMAQVAWSTAVLGLADA